jgi:hopanoid biosynthesis associated protein HpnK
LIPRKQLVVNADDFGFTPDVNEGIVEAHRHGILTAATLMANGEAFEDAVRLARETPSLDVGCHLVLIGGRSVVNGDPLPSTVRALLGALALRQIRVYDELRAQVRRIVGAGIQPSHLDTHKHTHLAPPVLEAVARIGEEFSISWIRRPLDFPLGAARGTVPVLKRLTSDALGFFRGSFHRVLRKHGCRTTDHFAGFQITGRFRTRELLELIALIPAGTTELMCHPGRCGAALRSAPTRLKQSREEELQALVSPEVREAIDRAGIELVNYGRLQ